MSKETQKTNVFISFSYDASSKIKEKMEEKLEQSNYAINYSEKEDRSHLEEATIWKNLKDRIAGSSVMIVIYSEDFERGRGGKALKVDDESYYLPNRKNNFEKQGWIYKELRCALRSSKNNKINGIIVVMPDDILDIRYKRCNCNIFYRNVKNISKKHLPPIISNNYCNKKHRSDNWICECSSDTLADSYIPIVSQSNFEKNPKYYIELVKEKRNHVDDYNIVKETD